MRARYDRKRVIRLPNQCGGQAPISRYLGYGSCSAQKCGARFEFVTAVMVVDTRGESPSRLTGIQYYCKEHAEAYGRRHGLVVPGMPAPESLAGWLKALLEIAVAPSDKKIEEMNLQLADSGITLYSVGNEPPAPAYSHGKYVLSAKGREIRYRGRRHG